ncbi:hypothetical protein CAPTEDRAFT_225242 [Capitella teleta]|uniref:Carbohydrate sulfotransferase n=1 Tax=Capitella teleta TaxID=283909 RepID=R7UGQ5_CAPTE|nr:hypothetical protein CAPTEDRAFT_225242 [Capitella teleta]|eukprot:ELU05405.1 hypothetical protein CAPTEDRAFT_225242 [Capitella teleta]
MISRQVKVIVVLATIMTFLSLLEQPNMPGPSPVKIREVKEQAYNKSVRIKVDICTPEERLTEISKWCSARGMLSWEQPLNRSLLRDFIVDERQQMLICDPLLIGRFEINAPRMTDIVLRNIGYRRLRKYNQKSYDHIMSTYTKVLRLRHPYERLVAGFQPGTEGLSRRPLNMAIWNTLKTRPRDRKQGPTFKMYAQYAAKMIQNNTISYVWKPYLKACHPCALQYDFVVRSEKSMPTCNCYSASDDLQGELGYHIQTKEDSATLSKRIDAYQDVDNKTMNILQSYFSSDMSLFGYQFSAKLQGSCWYNQTGCC